MTILLKQLILTSNSTILIKKGIKIFLNIIYGRNHYGCSEYSNPTTPFK